MRALSVAPELQAISAADGRVIAVLSQAIYGEVLQGYVFCITGSDAPDGPLTLRVPDLATVQAAIAEEPNATLQITPGSLQIANSLTITWTTAQHWVPRYPQPTGNPVAQAAAYAMLVTAIGQRNGLDGLGRLAPCLADLATSALPPPLAADPLLRRAAAALAGVFAGCHAHDTTAATTALLRLIGLGPGLTPSGDDVVAGILATLVWTQPPGWDVAAVVSAMRAATPHRTNRISARLLWHAGAGTLYAPALAVGAALLAGDPAAATTSAQQLFTLGHTSGVDLAVGLLAGLVLSLLGGTAVDLLRQGIAPVTPCTGLDRVKGAVL